MTEPCGGSTAAAPEAAQPIASVEVVETIPQPQPSEPAPAPTSETTPSAVDAESTVDTNATAIAKTIADAITTNAVSDASQLAKTTEPSEPPSQPVPSQPATPSVAAVSSPSVASVEPASTTPAPAAASVITNAPAVSTSPPAPIASPAPVAPAVSSTPPAPSAPSTPAPIAVSTPTPVAPTTSVPAAPAVSTASAPTAPSVPAPTAPTASTASTAPSVPEPVPLLPPNIKSEPTNDSFSAVTAALGTGLLESLQNAFKRPRTDDTDGDDAAQGNDAKRAKVEPAAEAPVEPEPTAAEVAPPMMDLEAMLKSALGSMNTGLSTLPPPPAPAAAISSTPAAPAPTLLPTPTASVAAVTPAVPAPAAPATSQAPISLTPTPAPSTPSLPTASAAITSPPPPPPPAAPIASPQTVWRTPAVPSPAKDATGPRKDVASPGGYSSSFGKKMRFAQNPTYISRSMGLPLLGSYAVLLLYALSENPGLGPKSDTDGEATETELRRVYKALRGAFLSTRKLFSETTAILNVDDLDIKEPDDQETILMANMATISSSIFEDEDISLVEAHDYFLSTFLPEADALSKDLAMLFLSLKHRTLAAELVKLPDDAKRSKFLERLFPNNLQEQLENMHPDTPLTEYEKEFMGDMMVAKERLLEAAKTNESRRQLQERYTLDGFRDELSAYLRANIDVVLRYAELHGIEIPGDDDGNGDESDIAMEDAEQAMPDATNGTDYAAMGDSIASMLSAAMASSGGLAAAVAAAPAQPSQQPASGTAPVVIDSAPNGAVSSRPVLEALPTATDVSRLIQNAVQQSEARMTSQSQSQSPQVAHTTAPAAPSSTITSSLLATPSVRAHTTGTTATGPTAVASAPAESKMDLTGLTKLIQDKLGQDAQNAQQSQTPAPALAPTPAYNPQQTQSPVVAQANAALSSMQNTFANNLAMYNRTPAYPYQQVPPTAPPPPPQPQQQHVNTMNGGNGSLPPNQSSPSAILYQQARQAAASKTQGHQRREGLHSTRRPWSPDEEQALMAGLDMVKGPHWSQILQLFGANGTISDILKDRSQVQLKDKARNLKLFFLKANTEMPYYLKCVTGELKTRAPSQAARKEAEERARATNKEEQARVQGIMTLAGGLQDNKVQQGTGQAQTQSQPQALAQAQVSSPATASPAKAPATVAPATAHNAAHNSAPNGNVPVNGAPRPVAPLAPNSAPNGAGVAGSAPRVNTPSAVQNIAPIQPLSNLPARIASATQLSPAVQKQLQQIQQQRQLQQQQQAQQAKQQAQLPRSPATTAAGTTTGATTGTAGAGTGTAGSTVPKRTPVTAADIALAASQGGYSATAQALANQQANGSAASSFVRPLLASGGRLGVSSLPLTTSASIRSATADLTAGMTAAINNAINNAAISNAAFAARPTSTMLTAAQRLAANRGASTSPSRSPAPQQRPTQSSPSPIRSLPPQSSAQTAARPTQPATTATGQNSPAQTARSIASPSTVAGSAPATPQLQNKAPAQAPAAAAAPATTAPTTTAASAPAAIPAKAPVTTAAAAAPVTTAPAAAPAKVATPTTTAPATVPAAATPQQPEDRLWMLQQHVSATNPAAAAPAAATTTPANGVANTSANKPSPAPVSVATIATSTSNSTPAPAVVAPTPTPAAVPTPPPAKPAPPPISQQQQQQQQQQQLKQEQQDEASEESVLRRLLASPQN